MDQTHEQDKSPAEVVQAKGDGHLSIGLKTLDPGSHKQHNNLLTQTTEKQVSIVLGYKLGNQKIHMPQIRASAMMLPSPTIPDALAEAQTLWRQVLFIYSCLHQDKKIKRLIKSYKSSKTSPSLCPCPRFRSRAQVLLGLLVSRFRRPFHCPHPRPSNLNFVGSSFPVPRVLWGLPKG